MMKRSARLDDGATSHIVRARAASKMEEKRKYTRRMDEGRTLRPCSKYESKQRMAEVANDNAVAAMEDHDLKAE